MRRWVPIVGVVALAVATIVPAAHAMSGMPARTGATNGTAEARRGWDQQPPSETAQAIRDRESEQIRVQDGSCEQCDVDEARTQARLEMRKSVRADDAEMARGPAATAGEDSQAQRREALRHLSRVESRLQTMGPGQAGDAVAALMRLTARIMAWLGAS